MFTEAGWYCTRAAASQSPMDLIAYKPFWAELTPCYNLFWDNGYKTKEANSKTIPLDRLASKQSNGNTMHVYYQYIEDSFMRWDVVLMQCKIKKRRRKK